MTSYVPARKNIAFIFYAGLPSQATPGTFQSNPTLAAGDFKVSIDGGSLTNLGTLPTVTPASSKMVKFSLSTSEMNGDNITIVCSDAAGSEWFDVIMNIQTAARQIDDLAYPATSGRSMVVDASGLVDANTVKIGPTGSGTAQTARDVGANVLLSVGTGTGQVNLSSGKAPATLASTDVTGNVAADLQTIKTQAVTCAGGVTVPAATLASTTNVTAGTITTVTNLTNAAGAGDFTSTMKTSLNAATPEVTVSDKTGFSLSSAGIQAIWDALTSALTTVGSIGKLLVTNLDAAISSRMATYTQPTGFLAATFPVTVASTTNITGGTITTVTNLTNAPSAGDFTSTMKTSLNAATPSVTISDKTGFSLTSAYDAAKTAAQAGDAMTLTGAYDAAKTAASATNLATANTGISAIKAKTDNLAFTVTGQVDSNAKSMNDTVIHGTGIAADLWRGA